MFRLSVRVIMYKILIIVRFRQSAVGGIKSHSMTALVSFVQPLVMASITQLCV